MIQTIRTFFKDRIREDNKDLKANKSPIAVDNMADTVIEDTYFIGIGDMTSERQDIGIVSVVAVTVDIYKKGNSKHNKIENYDKAYCEAIDIQANCSYQPKIDQAKIKNVISSGISVESIESNDNIYKFTIQFSVTIAYDYNN